MQKTKIAWTTRSWNVFSGCIKVSPGCRHCYGERIAEDKRGTRAFPNGFELTVRPHKLIEPFKLVEPSMVFVNSMSDFFLESVPDALRDQMVAVMAATPQHQYQVLTKRTEVMCRFLETRRLPENIWLGVSVENQLHARRVDDLRKCDAAVRFASIEPMLGPVKANLMDMDWVIVGGESGPHLDDPKNAKRALVEYVNGLWRPRPDRADWVRRIRDDCRKAGAAFFFKQWGGLRSDSNGNELDGETWEEFPGSAAS